MLKKKTLYCSVNIHFLNFLGLEKRPYFKTKTNKSKEKIYNTKQKPYKSKKKYFKTLDPD